MKWLLTALGWIWGLGEDGEETQNSGGETDGGPVADPDG
jgi:hypothetical protein